MKNRIVISSDHPDKHGDVMTKEALESGAKIINGDKSVKWTVEHKRDLPPLGKIADAEVIERDGHYYLTVSELPFDKYEDLDWGQNLLKAYCSTDNKPFNEPEAIAPDNLTIYLDPNIFISNDDFLKFKETLQLVSPELKTEEYFRKALINDPEFIITLTSYYLIFKILDLSIDSPAEKFAKIIAKKAANEVVGLYDLIKKSFAELIKRIKPTNRPISYVIKVNGTPEIELFARIIDPDKLIKALKTKKILELRSEIEDFQKHASIEKIQYTLSDNGQWKFNYLLTNKGEAIGTKRSFKKRDRKLEYVGKFSRLRNKN